MKKLATAFLALFQVLWLVPVASATVMVPSGPTVLVSSPMVAPASSAAIALFKFSLTQGAGETLSSVTVSINKNGVNNLVSSHLASVSVYKDNGDATFNAGTDLLAGSQTTVNINAPTTITTTTNNAIGSGSTFFVAVSTGASWSDVAPADSFTAQLATDAIATSSNSPTVTAATTAAITADTTGPHLTSAVAMNTGGTNVKEAGDSVQLMFNEPTNKPVLSASTIPTTFTLNNGHSFLDGLGVLLSAGWNVSGTVYTITLSNNVSLPTVEPGDTVTIGGSLVQDAAGNAATGNQIISGSFTADIIGPVLSSALALNSGGTNAKEAGDSVALTFGEATNKPAITDANVNATLSLNNAHSWLDGAGHIGSAIWNSAGTLLTITLSAGTSIPTVAVGDTVTVAGSVIQDASGNSASGSQPITGTFSTADTTPPHLTSAVALNTGGTSAKEAGDSVVLSFDEATTKPAITDSNIASTFGLNNAHSWLDGAGHIGGAVWNAGGTMLTITLSGGTSLPTVVVGDTVTVAGSVVQDAAGNSATGSSPITGTFGTVTTVGPVLTSAVAQNTGGTNAKEAGDSVQLSFNEATTKPAITDSNVNTTLTLNNSHSWLDGAGHIGSATWDSTGTVLTLTLSAGTSIPTVAVGDTVTVAGSVIQDASGNSATGSQPITGTFGTSTSGGGEKGGKVCPNGLINGRLYQVNGQGAVYLAAACRLKVFKGKAVGHAKGKKFMNIINLPSLPTVVPQVKVKPNTEDHGKADQENENEDNNEQHGQSASAHGNAAGANSHGKAKGHGKD